MLLSKFLLLFNWFNNIWMINQILNSHSFIFNFSRKSNFTTVGNSVMIYYFNAKYIVMLKVDLIIISFTQLH